MWGLEVCHRLTRCAVAVLLGFVRVVRIGAA